MVRYKLLKRYPSLHSDWEVGMIVEISEYDKNGYKPYDSKYTKCFVSIKEVENNPEFWKREFPVGSKVKDLTYGDTITKTDKGWLPGWEKSLDFIENNIGTRFEIIVEEDFEILKFETTSEGPSNQIWTLNEHKKYSPSKFAFDVSLEDMLSTGNCLKSGYFKITSVKRTSDGEVFNIGDLLSYCSSSHPNIDSPVITKIGIISDPNTEVAKMVIDREGDVTGSVMFVAGNKFENYNVLLKNAQKVRKPLFIAVDGIDIFEGDKFYILGNNTPVLVS